MVSERSSGISQSSLEFLSYRIVRLNFECGTTIQVSSAGIPENSRRRVGTGLADVRYSKKEGLYIVPVAAEIIISAPKEHEDSEIFRARAEINGFFRFNASEDIIEEEFKERLILNQTPAILMPFLRAAISSAVALAGFGAIPFPLLNMVNIAEEDQKRKIIEI